MRELDDNIDTICGIPMAMIYKFSEEIKINDVSFILEEYKNLYREVVMLRKANRVLLTQLEALEA